MKGFDSKFKNFPELKTSDVVPSYVARYWDLMALSDNQPVNVIGHNEQYFFPYHFDSLNSPKINKFLLYGSIFVSIQKHNQTM